MKKTLSAILAFTFLFISYAYAQESKTITLKDGTRVNGHITGIEEGQYVIKSPALGELKIPQDDILSITAVGAMSGAEPVAPQMQAPTSQYSAQLQTTQAQILANPALMGEIMEMMKDPQIMAIMSDPSLAEAAKSGNPQAMQMNPRTQELMNNPKMQELIKKLQAAQGQ